MQTITEKGLSAGNTFGELKKNTYFQNMPFASFKAINSIKMESDVIKHTRGLKPEKASL